MPDEVFSGVDTDVSNVVVLFIDAYGFQQFQETHINHSFFNRIARRGRVTPLTSVYPSATPACVPTLHTGLQPVEHGQLGWNLYLSERNQVVEALPFQTKRGESIDPDEVSLFAGEPIYPQLEAAGIDTHIVEPFDSSDDPKTEGATTHTYSSPAEFGVQLRKLLENGTNQTYCYGYTPLVDAAGHAEGTCSALHSAELHCLSATLQRELCDRLQSDVAEETLLLLVADHGQTDSNPDENVNILSDPVVKQHLKRDRDGVPAISGSGRNLHLFLDDGSADRVRTHLLERLDALVLTRAEALDSELWGTRKPCQMFADRIGDLVVIPETTTVWHGKEPKELALIGDHGGLHPREQLVPFGAVTLDRLADDGTTLTPC
ncbi:alkaline phosphatase family protein [Halovenus salina]|uniref:Alkaline phosphatase family protein n=1 Tax=Halovenus salina TaxID=1510225 RepID=A0ABD5W530_9EURY